MFNAPSRRHSLGGMAPGVRIGRSLCLCLCLAGAPTTVSGQYVAGGGSGFRFSAPEFSVTLRGGVDRPVARSNVFSFATNALTLSRGDFAALGVSFDFALRASARTEIVVTGGVASRESASEFRKFIDNDNQPIEQRTLLKRMPFSVGVRYALLSPGKQISSLAWIPARFTPWVGIGGGAMRYTFRQSGDFVDFRTLAVFPDTFSNDDWAPMAYGSIGGDWALSSRTALVADLRYTTARAPLRGAFEGFERIDLSGTAATMGISLRY